MGRGTCREPRGALEPSLIQDEVCDRGHDHLPTPGRQGPRGLLEISGDRSGFRGGGGGI